MNDQKLKVLLIIEQCNPEWSSVPLLAYKYFEQISKLVDATLVTHERNQKALEKLANNQKNVYIKESQLIKKYYSIIAKITATGRINWPLYHTLNYPMYEEFNRQVYKIFKDQIIRGDYDIVHVITPMIPRYPVKVIAACNNTPFILGPVNGGVSFPKGFQKIARQEFAYLNFFRDIGKLLIPGYRETYQRADKILVGSTFTLNMLRETFPLAADKMDLFYENGISKSFFIGQGKDNKNAEINLLFVGRLVPYKGADMLIEAVSKLDLVTQNKIRLTIVGDGSEKELLENKVQELSLKKIIKLVGWVPQEDTLEYYKEADIFCFPSIREFGGAVVLEAMACGLPCIVINNGGIAEYVTEETGFKIEPISREYVINELTNKINILVKNEVLRKNMSVKSVERVKEFEWEQKAIKIVEIYEKMMIKNKTYHQ